MKHASGQTIPAETIQAMGTDAARMVLAMGLTADQRNLVIAQVRQQKADMDGIAVVSPWHVGFLAVVDEAAGAGPTCPGCSGPGRRMLLDHPKAFRCTGCGGVFTTAVEPITLDEARKLVLLDGDMLANAGSDGQFLFDLDVIDPILADGTTNRLHGWADRATKRVVQWG